MHHPRIIVIDDETIVRAFVRRLVLKALPNANVVDVASAEEAWEKINTDGVDLVVTDCNLLGASGPDLTRNIRDQKLPLPVIMISGNDSCRGQGEEAGVDRFIEKRFLLNDLGPAIQTLLREGTRHLGDSVAAVERKS